MQRMRKKTFRIVGSSTLGIKTWPKPETAHEKSLAPRVGLPYPGYQRFFLACEEELRRHERRSVSGALSNCKHGLFHIRYFENGPLEPGYSWKGYANIAICQWLADQLFAEVEGWGK